MDRRGVRQVPGGSGEHRKLEKTGCELVPQRPSRLRDSLGEGEGEVVVFITCLSAMT